MLSLTGSRLSQYPTAFLTVMVVILESQVVGDKSVIYIGNSTALEMVHRQNIKWGSMSSGDDITGMFGMLATILKEKANKVSNMTWRISVDVGFRYLVRIHFCEIGLKMMEAGGKDFMLLINQMVASTSADILQERENDGSFWYKNYMVMVEGQKREGKRDIFISLHSKHEFLDRHSPLEGFEVFKLSNHDNSLASPNPPPPIRNSPSQTIQMLPLLGRHKISIVPFTIICLVNFIVYMLRQTWGDNFTEEEKMPSARVKRLCRRFSLAEIQSATENFYDAFFIGRGGFGKVYKGLMDNGQLSVAIKRLKPDSNQGKHQFWTEVEMLSELRHVNLVPLIGYCNEQREMILVYEYMPCGTLADLLYKLARKSSAYHSLSWKQRLKICIGAGRGLDYLHTGHGIIHRDVKASNILPDEKFVAKVSDFSLAKTGSGSELHSEASTDVKGTPGYIDPDYYRTRKITTKSDIYSFGVVLLEVLCGRPAVEQWVEEEKRSLTMWARDNISKGQVVQIVAPSLREEISPDSLKTFVRIAEKCLHDEPKRRPAIAHVVIILELALEQQENAESLALIERASVADVFPSTDNSQKETTSSSVSNERIIIADVLPQEGNARSLLSNEITNVADALTCTSKPQHERAKSLSPNEKKFIADALPGDNRTTISVSMILKAAFNNVQNVTSFLRKQINSKMINSGKRGERKSIMQKLSRKLLPWDAFRITRKSSKKKDLVSHALSAPILHTDKSQHEKPKSLSRCEKTSIAVALPGNVRSIFSVSTKLWAASPSVQNRTSLLREQMKSNMINSGKMDGRKSTMHELSRKLWLGDAFWKMKKLSKEEDLVSHALSVAVSEKTTTNTTSSSGSSAVSGNSRFLVASGSDEASPNAAGHWLPQPNLRIFTFAELKAATRNFRSDAVLGEGCFGKVYKGWLDERASGKTGSGTVIAVKKLNSNGPQGFQEWQSEVNFLGRLSHPNLVKLLGYGWEDKELLLVYEFMAKGSLENHLFRRGSSVQPLPWDIRLKILIGAARGLAFLHASDRKVIYRDFKASNILLDASYHAKISDFGLAKMGPTASQSHVTTRVMGTCGYAAPEYVATGHLYVKSDVYGFGVVLLEMLTGLRALDRNRPSGQHYLVGWMKPHLSERRKLKKIIDSRLEGRYPSRSALQQIAQLALNCLEGEPRNRPSMQEVVEILERTESVEKARQPRVHFDLGNFDGN